MKLQGIKYLNEKYTFFTGKYFNKVLISLVNVSQEELKKIYDMVKSNVYWKSIFGYYNGDKERGQMIIGNIRDKVTLVSKKNDMVNIFVKGPNAEVIEEKILELIPQEKINLEGRVEIE